MADAIKDSDDSSPKENSSSLPNGGKNHARSRALWLFTLLLLIAGLAWFAYWFFYLQ